MSAPTGPSWEKKLGCVRRSDFSDDLLMAFDMEAAEQTRRLQQEQKMNLSPKQSVMSSNASFRHTPTRQRVVLKSIATALHAGLKADIGQGIFVLGFLWQWHSKYRGVGRKGKETSGRRRCG